MTYPRQHRHISNVSASSRSHGNPRGRRWRCIWDASHPSHPARSRAPSLPRLPSRPLQVCSGMLQGAQPCKNARRAASGVCFSPRLRLGNGSVFVLELRRKLRRAKDALSQFANNLGTSPKQYNGRLLCRYHQAHSALKVLEQRTHRLN